LSGADQQPSPWPAIDQDGRSSSTPVKQVSFASEVVRSLGRFAAFSGGLALLVWLTWVMLDFRHLQSGFTLP